MFGRLKTRSKTARLNPRLAGNALPPSYIQTTRIIAMNVKRQFTREQIAAFRGNYQSELGVEIWMCAARELELTDVDSRRIIAMQANDATRKLDYPDVVWTPNAALHDALGVVIESIIRAG